MHVFYTPDIQKTNELPEEEAQHCTRVLRLSIGDEITLTDGKGSFYKAEITAATNKRCLVAIKETIFQKPLWPCHLHIAMAPTKNMDRNEWFAEKATEIGFDELTFLNCRFSERKVIKNERIEKILISAIKQSLKARHGRKLPWSGSRCRTEIHPPKQTGRLPAQPPSASSTWNGRFQCCSNCKSTWHCVLHN